MQLNPHHSKLNEWVFTDKEQEDLHNIFSSDLVINYMNTHLAMLFHEYSLKLNPSSDMSTEQIANMRTQLHGAREIITKLQMV